MHEKFEGELTTIKNAISDNLSASNQSNIKVDSMAKIIRIMNAEADSEADRYAALRKFHMEKDLLQYEVFQDDADILISAMSNTHLKEISNLVKFNSIFEGPENSEGNFV